MGEDLELKERIVNLNEDGRCKLGKNNNYRRKVWILL